MIFFDKNDCAYCEKLYFCKHKTNETLRSLKDALVVELVDTRDLKSLEHYVRAGSSPARGTQTTIEDKVHLLWLQ